MAFVVVTYEVLDRVFVDGETVDHRMVSIQEEIFGRNHVQWLYRRTGGFRLLRSTDSIVNPYRHKKCGRVLARYVGTENRVTPKVS